MTSLTFSSSRASSSRSLVLGSVSRRRQGQPHLAQRLAQCAGPPASAASGRGRPRAGAMAIDARAARRAGGQARRPARTSGGRSSGSPASMCRSTRFWYIASDRNGRIGATMRAAVRQRRVQRREGSAASGAGRGRAHALARTAQVPGREVVDERWRGRARRPRVEVGQPCGSTSRARPAVRDRIQRSSTGWPSAGWRRRARAPDAQPASRA